MVVLEENYRSHQEIIDAAHSLMKSPSLRASRGKGKTMRIATFATREQELVWLSKEPLAGATILVRDNKDVETVVGALAKRKVPYILEAEDDLFTNTYVRQIVSFLYVVHDFGKDEYLLSALHAPALGLDPLVVYKLFHQAYKERKPVYELLKHSEFANTYKLFASWKSYEYIHGAVALIEKLCEESGLLSMALGSKDPESALLAMSSFLDYVRVSATRSGKVNLSSLIRHIELSHKYRINHKIRETGRVGEGVRIMTTHRSKGLEFERVYVVFAEDGRFGGRKPREHLVLPSEKLGEHLDDERRLFYVALTRGKNEVTISYAKTVDGKEVLPSVFIAEIDQNLVEDVSPGVEEGERETLVASLSPRHEPVFALSDVDFVRERFAEQGLSVSALNNYLECPWKYFYQSLVRVPRAQDKFALFGTAVHEALHKLNESIAGGEVLGVKEFVDEFVTNMSRQPLPKVDMDESIKKGREALTSYYKHYKSSWHKNILSELDIKGVHLILDKQERAKNSSDEKFEPILLRGRIDKVELVGGNKVRVVDYKTGKAKSKNMLMGQTRNSTGNEYRQLLFYKILLDRYKNGMYKVETGEINFVEPVALAGRSNENGKFKTETFEIDQAEVEKLEQEVVRVAEEIRNLTFWNKKCEAKDCPYCALRTMMRPES